MLEATRMNNGKLLISETEMEKIKNLLDNKKIEVKELEELEKIFEKKKDLIFELIDQQNLKENSFYILQNLRNIFRENNEKPTNDQIFQITDKKKIFCKKSFLFEKDLVSRVPSKIIYIRPISRNVIPCFENVSNIIYVADMNDYRRFKKLKSEKTKKVCFSFLLAMNFFKKINKLFLPRRLSLYLLSFVSHEDSKQYNKMDESFRQFGDISNSSHFKEIPIFLYLDGFQALEANLVRSPFSNFFPQYQGPNEKEAVSDYIKNLFLEQLDSYKNVYVHFTNSFDTQNIRFIWEATNSIGFMCD